MLKVQGKVLMFSDEIKEFAVKDNNGVPTDKTAKHRITNILIDWECEKGVHVSCSVKGFDLPSTFQLPQNGESWVSPELRSIEVKNFQPVASIA